MIYDLFGIPGSGKSTICDYVEKNCNITDIKNKYIEDFIGKVIFHLYLYLFFLDKASLKKYKQIKKIIGNYKDYSNYINPKTKISLYIKYMLFDYYIETKVKKDCIIDEGIIHYCISLYVEFDLEIDKILKIIDLLKVEKIEYIGLSCSIDECIKNIKKRNRKRCDIDFLEGNDLISFLEKWNEGFNIMSKKYKTDNINNLKEYFKNKE